MNTSLISLDLTCGGQFAVPAFDLHTRASDLLRALHERLAPTSPTRASDTKVRGGTHLSDVLVSIGLEREEGHIEVTPQRLLVAFEDLSGWSELVECQARIALIHEITREVLSVPAINDTVLGAFILLQIESPDQEARNFLANQMTFKKSPVIENATLSPGIYLTISGDKFDEWHGHLRISMSDMDPSVHFIDFNIHYQPEFGSKEFPKRFEHFQELLRNLLEEVDLALPESSTEEVLPR